ncbi:MAG: hypothetical protein ABII19_04135 [Patescibacteria group bacterium]
MGKKKRKEPRGDIVALRAAVAEARGEEVSDGKGGAYSALKRDQPVCDFGEGRKCACCGCSLIRSNPDEFCWACDAIIAEWKNFPWNRAEIEQRIAKHCLDYVRAKLTRKKARHDVPRDIASGSFTRAVGRREIGRKVKKGRR